MLGRKRGEESGQVLVIFAVGLIALIGFTALALDGGMVLSDRRYDQNGADTAALAGGKAAGEFLQSNGIIFSNFSCPPSSGLISAAATGAIARASANNFSISQAVSEGENAVWLENCTNQMFEKHIDVHVRITTETKTSLIHMFYKGKVQNTVNAVVRIRPATDYAMGNTIVALSQTCAGNDGGIRMDGGSEITVTSGGMFSNSCIEANGTAQTIDVVEHILYRTTYTESGSPDYPPPPSAYPAHTSEFFDRPNVTDPCTTPTSVTNEVVGHNTTLGSATAPYINYYGSISVHGSHDRLTLNPGLYCLYGDFVASSGTVIGNGVTLVFHRTLSHNNPTSFSISAGTQSDEPVIKLKAPDPDPGTDDCLEGICPPAIPGMLILMVNGNDGSVSIEGNTTSEFFGTILAPDGTVDLGGTNNSTTQMGVRVIADTVKIHGNVTLNFFSSSDDQAGDPAMMDMFK